MEAKLGNDCLMFGSAHSTVAPDCHSTSVSDTDMEGQSLRTRRVGAVSRIRTVGMHIGLKER